jgi:hypothetical protein
MYGALANSHRTQPGSVRTSHHASAHFGTPRMKPHDFVKTKLSSRCSQGSTWSGLSQL